MREIKNGYRISVGRSEGKRPFGTVRNKLRIMLNRILDWTQLTEGR
jgi:hypothetical protein